MKAAWIRTALVGLTAAAWLSACGTTTPRAGTTTNLPATPVTATITTVPAATAALQAKIPGWTVSVVALPAGGFEAAAYDTTGQINRWAYGGASWQLTARARWPRGANGVIEGPAQHLYPNASPTAIAGGIVTGMRHATFLLSMSGWSDSVSTIGPTDLVYATSARGVFGTVRFHQDAYGNNKTLVPGEVDPQKISDLALQPAGSSVSQGVLLTPDSQSNSWNWNGAAFVPVHPVTVPPPTHAPTPSAVQAPCGDWGLPSGSKVDQVLYCKDGWAVLGYSQPGVPARETFRAHYINGRWEHADNLCANPTPQVPKAWVSACQVG